MAFRIEQPAVVMLAMNLHRQSAKVAEQARRYAGTADEGAAAAVALECPPDDQCFARLWLDALIGQ